MDRAPINNYLTTNNYKIKLKLTNTQIPYYTKFIFDDLQ